MTANLVAPSSRLVITYCPPADLKPDPANVAKLTAWLAERNLALRDLRAGRHSLEDVFLRLTKESD